MQAALSDLSFAMLAFLHYSTSTFSLCIEYATFTPTQGPLHCYSLCQGSSQSFFFTIQIPILVSPPLRDPLCPSLQDPFPILYAISSFSCLEVLESVLFGFAIVCLPHFGISSFRGQGIVLFTIMSSQYLEGS